MMGWHVLQGRGRKPFRDSRDSRDSGACQATSPVSHTKPCGDLMNGPFTDTAKPQPLLGTTTGESACAGSLAEPPVALTHLQRLEAESVHIMREVVAECDDPVMLYSMGKDSAVMLHVAQKAFAPAPLPFPLLHVDTTWKFRDMYDFRKRVTEQPGLEMLVYQNP